MPYRDFAVEYPPAALPAFVLPSLAVGPHDFPAYMRAFETLMGACGVACAALVAFVLTRLPASPPRLALGIGLAALGPLALGPVLLSRFDLWPAALTVATLAALVCARPRLGLALLGLAAAAKLYPLVLVPPALVHVERRHGRREALLGGAALAGVLAAAFLPFVALAPHGLWTSMSGQLSRPLQIESLGSGLLLAAHHVFGVPVAVRPGHGSDNLAGGAAHALALEQTVLQAGAVLALWVGFARGRAGVDELLRVCAAAVCAFVALGKVLSPQYLGWLLPLVPLVRGRRGRRASVLLLAAMLLTQAWFPYRYLRLAYRLDPLASGLVLARDLVLVALLAVLAWPERASGHSDVATQERAVPRSSRSRNARAA